MPALADWNAIEKDLYGKQWIKDIANDDARQKAAERVAKEEQARTDALADFKKGAGLGLSITFGSEQNTIEDAKLVERKIVVTRRSKDQPRAAMEVHQLFTGNIFTPTGREAARLQLEECGISPLRCPMWGIGPFAVVQTGADNAVSSLGLGVMLGVRADPRKGNSFNVGFGFALDGRVKRLADGYEEGDELPVGESTVPIVEKSARRLMLTLSFAF